MVGTEGERRRISTVASTIMVVGIGAAVAYLGVRLVLAGAFAASHGEPLLGVAMLVLGVALVAAPVAVLVSQVRAMVRHRG